MAYYRKTICSAPGCTNYAESGCIYCSEHKKQYIKRGTTSKFVKFYKLSRFAKERKEWLLRPENMWCSVCGKPSKLPHHSHGFNDYDSFFDQRWWVPMCSSCHSKLHTTVTNEQLWDKYGGKQ